MSFTGSIDSKISLSHQIEIIFWNLFLWKLLKHSSVENELQCPT